MMVSIIEIVLYTKPTSIMSPLHTKRAFPFSLAVRIRAYVPPTRRTVSVSSTRRYNVFILSHSHSSDSPSNSLRIIYISQARAFTFSYIPNIVLPCLNIYLSLPSYVLRSWTFAKWISRLEPELSINVMVLYTVQGPLFFGKIVEKERYRRPFLPGLELRAFIIKWSVSKFIKRGANKENVWEHENTGQF